MKKLVFLILAFIITSCNTILKIEEIRLKVFGYITIAIIVIAFFIIMSNDDEKKR